MFLHLIEFAFKENVIPEYFCIVISFDVSDLFFSLDYNNFTIRLSIQVLLKNKNSKNLRKGGFGSYDQSYCLKGEFHLMLELMFLNISTFFYWQTFSIGGM